MDTKLSQITTDASADIKALMADFAALRADVARLTSSLKTDAVRAAESAATQVNTEATRLMGSATDAGKSSVAAVERQVDAHPLVSLMLAFSLGFVGSRLLTK